MTTQDRLADYHRWCHAHAAEILADPGLHALASLSLAALSEAGAEAAGLKAQLDRYQGREVYYCTDAQATDAQSLVVPVPGTVIRATDTGREWEFTPAGWEPR